MIDFDTAVADFPIGRTQPCSESLRLFPLALILAVLLSLAAAHDPPMPAAPRQRQPWPMKWIVVAILLIIVPYTFLTLHYRKPGPAFQPYEDIKNRTNVARLLSAGYQRISLPANRPADRTGTSGGAVVTVSAGGLPAELSSTLVEPLLLPGEILKVTAAPTASIFLPYAIELVCTLPDDKKQLSGAELYVRGETLVIAPTFEQVAGDLLTRTRQAIVLLTVPAGAVKPGRYQVTLVGERTSRTWSLEVQ